jgi:hypothetical protein
MMMNAIREIYEKAPETIQITIPDSLRHRRVEVLLIELDGASEAVDVNGWPVGFFEQTFGSIPDFPEREPQGEYEQREKLS